MLESVWKNGRVRGFIYTSDCAVSTEMRPSFRSKAVIKVKKRLRSAVMDYAAREGNAAAAKKWWRRGNKYGIG